MSSALFVACRERPELAAPLVRYLNQLLDLDRTAISALIESRVDCNEALSEHPTVPVQYVSAEQPNRVGLLGVLNGFLGVTQTPDGQPFGHIVAVYDDEGQILEFRTTATLPVAKRPVCIPGGICHAD